jgi:hypothetical protein
MHVASVLCGCCKNRLGCCICCNGYTHMLCLLQMFRLLQKDVAFIWVLHLFYTYVASVPSRCCIFFHTYVASVSSRCCICFVMITHVFPSCFKHMLQVFQLFQTYVANVSSRCCKNRFGVAHVVVNTISTAPRLLQLLGPLTCACVWRGASDRHGEPCGRRLRQSWRGKRSNTGHEEGTGNGAAWDRR